MTKMTCALSWLGRSSPNSYTLSLHDALPISGAAPRYAIDIAGEYLRPQPKRVGTGNRTQDPPAPPNTETVFARSEEHTSVLQSPDHLVCRLLLEKKKL